jgi:hypothetical protein
LTVENLSRNLERIGVHLSAPEIQVLGAMLRAGNETQGEITFHQIYASITSKKTKAPSRAWVYKCISNLESNQFITVNRLGRPRHYTATIETIMAGLTNSRNRQESILEDERKELSENLESLEGADMQDVASIIVGIMTGRKPKLTSGHIEGRANVRIAMIRELCGSIGPGDVLRLTEGANLLDLSPAKSGPVEKALLEAIQEGLTIKALLTSQIPQGQGPASLASFLSKTSSLVVQGILDGRLQLRATPQPTSTYRMLCLNKEKMILFMSKAPYPDSAALIHRDDNATMVDDAVATFDKLWESAIDISAILKQAITSGNMSGNESFE